MLGAAVVGFFLFCRWRRCAEVARRGYAAVSLFPLTTPIHIVAHAPSPSHTPSPLDPRSLARARRSSRLVACGRWGKPSHVACD
jgi:hypothetical protein